MADTSEARSALSLDEVAEQVQADDWSIVAWGADRYDSIEYAIHRKSGGKEVMLIVLITPDGEQAHYLSQVWVDGGATVDMASEVADIFAAPERLSRMFQEAIMGWSDAIDNPRRTETSEIVPMPDELALPSTSPKERYLSHRLAIERIERQTELDLERLGVGLAEALSTFGSKGVERTVLLLPRTLLAVTVLALVGLSGQLAYYSPALTEFAGSASLVIRALGGIGYGGIIATTAFYVGLPSRRDLAKTLPLALFAFIVLPIAISLRYLPGLAFTGYGSLTLALSVVAAVGVAGVSALFFRSQSTRPNTRADLYRDYVSRADLAIAEAREQAATYRAIHVADMAELDGERFAALVDFGPDPTASWLRSARREVMSTTRSHLAVFGDSGPDADSD